MHARTDSQNTEGGAGWAEHLRWAALESGTSSLGRLRSSIDLAGRARVPAASSLRLPFDAPGGNYRNIKDKHVKHSHGAGTLPFNDTHVSFIIIIITIIFYHDRDGV